MGRNRLSRDYTGASSTARAAGVIVESQTDCANGPILVTGARRSANSSGLSAAGGVAVGVPCLPLETADVENLERSISRVSARLKTSPTMGTLS